MSDNGAMWFVYPATPFIGEAVMHLILACNNEPRADGKPSVNEREHAQISIALLMVALESLVKIKLHRIDKIEPSDKGELFTTTLQGYTKEHGALNLWQELQILRNQVMHSAYFESSKKGSVISTATLQRLQTKRTSSKIDLENESTINWKLQINPLSVSRYEAFICLLFFYWYGKESETWISNLPLHATYVDERLRTSIKNDWIDRDLFASLIGEGSNYIQFLSFMWGRLSEQYQKQSNRLSIEELGIDLEEYNSATMTMLEMMKNTHVVYGSGKDE